MWFPIVLLVIFTIVQAVYNIGEDDEHLNCAELINNYLSEKWAIGYNTADNYESYICVDDDGMFRQYTTISSSPDFICSAEELDDYTNVGSLPDEGTNYSSIEYSGLLLKGQLIEK